MPDDAVNHPRHYTVHPSGVECIEITRHMNFNLGNVLKYIWRADLKHADGGIADLEKAAWYLADEITRRKALQAPRSGPARVAAWDRQRDFCDHGRPVLSYCPDCAAIMNARNLTAAHD